MRRLGATVLIDVRRQLAEGFWLVALIVALVLAAVLRAFDLDWAVLWPVILLADLNITAFYFATVQVLMQRAEGTLDAQVVAPLRPWEYLFSLVVSLGMLSLVEMTALVLLGFGWQLNWPAYLAATAVTATLYVVYGFIAVSGYRSISQFLLPSGVWTAVFAIPILPLVGAPTGWWLWLHPLQPAVVLTQVAFGGLDPWRAGPALVTATIWALIGFKVANSRFQRFIAARQA